MAFVLVEQGLNLRLKTRMCVQNVIIDYMLLQKLSNNNYVVNFDRWNEEDELDGV